MRRSMARRVLCAVCAAAALGCSFSLAQNAIYRAVAETQLALLNAELGTESTLDQDTMSPANFAKSQDLLRRVREAMKKNKRPPRELVATKRS